MVLWKNKITIFYILKYSDFRNNLRWHLCLYTWKVWKDFLPQCSEVKNTHQLNVVASLSLVCFVFTYYCKTNQLINTNTTFERDGTEWKNSVKTWNKWDFFFLYSILPAFLHGIFSELIITMFRKNIDRTPWHWPHITVNDTTLVTLMLIINNKM